MKVIRGKRSVWACEDVLLSDLECLATQNQYMIKNNLRYLPDEMIDPSILTFLKKETELTKGKTRFFQSKELVQQTSPYKYGNIYTDA